jgi:radical SAM protein with 4Fe4S-binding SPASM domain
MGKRFAKIYLEISNVCNLSCSFCPGTRREKRFVQPEEFQTLLPKLRPWTDYLYFHLMGEPLLHPHLGEYLELAGKAGFKVILTTNGTLLAKRGQALLEAGVHKVSISLHSFENGTEQAQRQYLSQVADFAEKAAAGGIIICLRLWNRGHETGSPEVILRQLLPGDWQENTRGYRVRDKLFLEWGDRFGWPDKENEIQEGNPVCYGMRNQFGILSDGTVVPCCLDSEGVINLGNVFETPLAEILAVPRAKAIADGFQKGIAAEDLCRRCPYARKKQH